MKLEQKLMTEKVKNKLDKLSISNFQLVSTSQPLLCLFNRNANTHIQNQGKQLLIFSLKKHPKPGFN